MLETIVSALNEKELSFATKKVTIAKMANLLSSNGWQAVDSYHFNQKPITVNKMVSMLKAQGWK